MREEIKKRGGNRNSPTVGNNGLMAEPGDLTNYIANMMEIKRLPMPKTDEEIEQRIDLYFMWCIEKDMRPGIEGLSFALGISRKTLWDWEQGYSWEHTRRAELVRYAKQGIAMLTEQMGLKGKLNPVSYIFTMKNNFGYTDKTEISYPKDNYGPLGKPIPLEELKKMIPKDIIEGTDYHETDDYSPDEI